MGAGSTDVAARGLRAVGLALLVAAVAVQLPDIERFWNAARAAIAHPYQLDYGEGPLLDQIRTMRAGETIYPSPDRPPHVIGNYPPVYHLAIRLIDQTVGNTLAVGRALSALSAALIAALIGVLVVRAAQPSAGRVARGLAAAAAALAFSRVSYTASWAPLMRVDMLADLFAFAGVVIFALLADQRGSVAWCVLPLALAVFTKQSAIAAAATCVIVAAFARPRRGAQLAALLAVAGAIGLALLVGVEGGNPFFHLITANRNAYDWWQTAAYLQDMVRRYPVALAIAAVGARALFADWPPRRGAAEPVAWERPVLGVYLLAALAMSLTVGKVGSEVNYLIEVMGVVWACAGVAVADSFAPPVTRAESPLPAALASVLLPALLLVQVSGLIERPGIEWVEVPSARATDETRRLVERLRETEGPVLSEDVTLLVIAGKRVELQPFEMTQLAQQGLWDPAPFVQRIRAGEFALVVLEFNAAAPTPLAETRFPPAVLDAIRTTYGPPQRAAHYWIYTP